jgi:hypothetical protein
MAVLALQLLCMAFLAVGQPRQVSSPLARPQRVVRQSAAHSSGLVTTTNETTILSATADAPAIVTLDYGHSVEGIPTFEVLSMEGDASVFEITYAESLAALDIYMVIEAKCGRGPSNHPC